MDKVNDMIINDTTRLDFNDEEKMLDFLTELSTQTIKVHKNLGDLRVVHEENGEGMFANEVATTFGLDDTPIEAITSTLSGKGSQMLMVEKEEKEDKAYLLSNFGYMSLVAQLEADTKNFKNLPKKDQALITNIYADNMITSRTGNFLIRGHKIRAVRGENFADLNQDMLFKSVTGLIHGELGGGQFKKGTFEHALTRAMWTLPNATGLLEAYNSKMENSKSLYRKRSLVPAIEFTTSDVGLCSATITIALSDVDDGYELILSSPIRIEHRSGKEISRFEESLDDVSDFLHQAVESMSDMLDIEVPDVVEVARLMIATDITRIGQRPLEKAIKKFYEQNEGEKVYVGTAHDVFLMLHDAFSIMRTEGRKLNQKSLELVGNNIAKLINPDYNWAKYIAKASKPKRKK